MKNKVVEICIVKEVESIDDNKLERNKMLAYRENIANNSSAEKYYLIKDATISMKKVIERTRIILWRTL